MRVERFGGIMSKVLVTGAFGFVGQWLVKELLKQGNEVTVVSHDNMTTYHNWTIGDVNIVKGDIRNYSFLNRTFNQIKPNLVFHLAAQALVEEALKSPYVTLKTNVGGTTNLLECARNYGKLDRIVVASSDKAYGNEKSPYYESTSLNGRFPYDCSKSCADLISQSYRDTYDMPISIMRCGNIFGGGDFNWSRVFPESIKSCYDHRAMTIRSDGKSMLRDYIYIEDVISAYLFISNLDHNEIVNASYGNARSVLDILHAVQKETGVYYDPQIKNTAKCEINVQCLNGDHIKSLGWNPKYNFDGGVRETVDWYYGYFESI